MEIRRARTADIERLEALLAQVLEVHATGRPDLFKHGTTKYTERELEEILADDARPVFVACDGDGVVAGYAFCVFQRHANDNVLQDVRTLYVDDICVDEASRGNGVGRALYEHVVAFAREEGFYNVTLNVWSCNPGAMRFYESLGMRPYKIGMEEVL